MNVVLGVLFVVLPILNVSAALKVTVYYETLCPDSVQFITRQLHPHYKEIIKYMDLELVPYGKAIHDAVNGTWTFSCQHGSNECTGNMYQSCVLSLKSGAEKDVEFVNCIMRRRYPWHLRSLEECATRFNLDVQKIKSCASSEEGNALLARNGDKTWKDLPNIAFVPTIVYNDTFDQTSHSQSLRDFVAVVCSKIKDVKPTICKNRPLPSAQYYWF